MTSATRSPSCPDQFPRCGPSVASVSIDARSHSVDNAGLNRTRSPSRMTRWPGRCATKDEPRKRIRTAVISSARVSSGKRNTRMPGVVCGGKRRTSAKSRSLETSAAAVRFALAATRSSSASPKPVSRTCSTLCPNARNAANAERGMLASNRNFTRLGQAMDAAIPRQRERWRTPEPPGCPRR